MSRPTHTPRQWYHLLTFTSKLTHDRSAAHDTPSCCQNGHAGLLSRDHGNHVSSSEQRVPRAYAHEAARALIVVASEDGQVDRGDRCFLLPDVVFLGRVDWREEREVPARADFVPIGRMEVLWDAFTCSAASSNGMH